MNEVPLRWARSTAKDRRCQGTDFVGYMQLSEENPNQDNQPVASTAQDMLMVLVASLLQETMENCWWHRRTRISSALRYPWFPTAAHFVSADETHFVRSHPPHDLFPSFKRARSRCHKNNYQFYVD